MKLVIPMLQLGADEKNVAEKLFGDNLTSEVIDFINSEVEKYGESIIDSLDGDQESINNFVCVYTDIEDLNENERHYVDDLVYEFSENINDQFEVELYVTGSEGNGFYFVRNLLGDSNV